ncbi:hypothetical protein QT711_08240 [Sporosarcina saromensis]|uniref:Group-specific protein n=1 Tax=Sporosarcina saromensis TaxID=359365 RepID=A0ABU4G875_9BACL|nr:hypothetical protein [Sporosarcina saromensis]MDW0113174.1 hypothetical protein [Sporosarcina saromensis]
MGRCTIDHSVEDVVRKLNEQQAFIPKKIYEDGMRFLDGTVEQDTLNEVFHLLKKYDLVEADERERRNEELRKIVR